MTQSLQRTHDELVLVLVLVLVLMLVLVALGGDHREAAARKQNPYQWNMFSRSSKKTVAQRGRCNVALKLHRTPTSPRRNRR